MKILITNWRDIKHPRAGGAEKHLFSIFSILSQRGHAIILYCSLFSKGATKEIVDGIQVYRLGSEYTFQWKCMRNLKKWISVHKPDVFIEDLNKLPIYSPFLVNLPKIIQIHHLWKSSIFKETFFPIAFFVYLQEQSIKWFYQKEKFAVVSPSTQKDLVSLGISDQNTQVIYNGCEDLPSASQLKSKKENFSILWLGRIQKYKGVLEACQAFSKLITAHSKYKNLILNIAGDGPFLPKLRKWVQENNLKDKINLLGFVTENDKQNLLKNSIFLLQTSYKEGWGLSVIEAARWGTISIGNNTAGLCDSIQHKKTGILYNYNDINDLYTKILWLLENTDQRKQMSRNAIEWAKQFSWKQIASQTERMLLEQIESKVRKV